MRLNPQQLAAVVHFETPLLVLAGAGSGKTGVITKKIAWLIEQQRYQPQSIVAVTFTNKASVEMRSRLKKQLQPEQIRGLTIATFHRLGLNILHRDGEAAGLRRGFTILDQSDSLNALKELAREDNCPLDAAILQRHISGWKNDFISPAQAQQIAEDEQQHTAALLFSRYNDLLRACNSADFDDLIGLPVSLLRENIDLRDKWRQKIRHLLVDEYQDTNAAQYELVRLLVDKFGALTAVGDDDQSIYSWRGARPENLLALKADYPNLKVIKLEQNYRSSQRILRCANAVISHNPHVFEKRLWSDLGLGDPLRVSVCKHTKDEAEWV
ncbi:MAG: UvrD-helicase domain-containing protein, partial [Granulosicoccus sp.]